MGNPLLSKGVALVINADLIHIGDQSGCLLRDSAAIPEMCGADSEVPDSELKLLPVAGATAAMTSTPGAVMSGFSRSPPPALAGPNDEKPAIAGARTGAVLTAEIAA